MVGIVWGLLSNNWSQFSQSGMFTFPEGLLGGALFAIANLLIPTVVNTLGLGVGFMLWNATNVTLGYCVSRLGLFGVSPTIPSMPWVSLLGIGFMLASIAVYGTIKPTLKAAKTSRRVRKTKSKSNGDTEGNGEAKVHWESVGSNNSLTSSLGETSPLLPQFAADAELANVALVRRESLQESLVHPELPNFGPYMMPNELGEHVELTDAGAEKTRKAFGMAIALLVGAFLSCCLVPFVNWKDRCRPSDPALSSPIVETCNPLNFVFSQCLGVYLTSTIVFLLYSLFTGSCSSARCLEASCGLRTFAASCGALDSVASSTPSASLVSTRYFLSAPSARPWCRCSGLPDTSRRSKARRICTHWRSAQCSFSLARACVSSPCKKTSKGQIKDKYRAV